MKDLLDFLKAPYAGLLLTPLVLWGAVHLGATRLGLDLPWYATALIAFILTPQVWLAAILFLNLHRYMKAVDKRAPDQWRVAQQVLMQTRTTYGLRERFSAPFLGASVYGAYGAVSMAIRATARRATLNTHNSLHDESLAYRRAQGRANFQFIAEFLLRSSIAFQDLGEGSSATKMIDHVPPTQHTQDVLRSTYLDGAGVLSTVNFATLLHFISTQPDEVTREVLAAIDQVPFDPDLFGWLGLRVVEAAVAMVVLDRATPERVRLTLLPITESAGAELRRAPTKEDRDEVKWNARKNLRRIAHLPEDKEAAIHQSLE